MLRQSLGLCYLLMLLSACSKPVPEKPQIDDAQPGLDSRGLISQFNLLAYQSLANTTQQLEKLESSLAELMQLPNPGNLELTQQAWISAHNTWLKARLLTQLNLADSHSVEDPELLQRIDSWPVMGGYIDYLSGYPFSGIVNDLTLPMEAAVIQQQQGFGVSQGFHALEFMLWGEDGQRSARDFIPQENTQPLDIDNDHSLLAEGDEPSVTADKPAAELTTPEQALDTEEASVTESSPELIIPNTKPQNHMRRRQYVRLISHMLSEDMQKLQRHWEPAQGYYTELLASQPANNSLLQILKAMQKVLLADISEQLAADQDNQHSAFNQQQHRSYHEILIGLDGFYKNTQSDDTLAAALNQLQPEIAARYNNQLKQALDLGQKISKKNQLQDKDKHALLKAINQLQKVHSELPTALRLSAL